MQALLLFLAGVFVVAWAVRGPVLRRGGVVAGAALALTAVALVWLHAWFVLT